VNETEGAAALAPPTGTPPLGARLRQALTTSALVILCGVFVSGVGMTAGFYEWLKPWRLDKDYQKLEKTAASASGSGSLSGLPSGLPRLKLPIKVGVIGPLTGRDSDFGLSQLRGVLSGVMQATVEYFHKPAEDWPSLFSIRPVNIDFKPSVDRADRLAEAFRQAEDDDDVVFGPVSSQDAIDILIHHKEAVKVPTIITTAATYQIRKHEQYGKLLLQLSPNIDTYSSQYMRYIGQFLQPRPRSILLFARDDEYGRSSVVSLTKYAAMYEIGVQSISYVSYVPGGQTKSDFANSILRNAGGDLTAVQKKPEDWLIMFADTGEVLRALAVGVRKVVPNVRMGTLSSPDEDEVATGAFEGMYLIYSFAPVQFSVDTLAFYQYARAAQPFLNDLLDGSPPSEWPKLETVDAEVHDATSYWIQRFVTNQLGDFKGDASKNLYVTNFSVRGGGPSFGNDGALYLFIIRNSKIVPVEVDVN
jgi:ABC-type branched-subunit amino acid transport system substrate-binding protein